MSEGIFSGSEVSLIEMLDARESRAQRQERLLNEYPDAALLLATMNIPGPVKNSTTLSRVFSQLVEQIKKELTAYQVFTIREDNLKTGPEFYAVVKVSPLTLKEKMIDIEENHPYGRLLDLDIHYISGGLQSVSRQDIELPPRKCLICQKNAKECGRERRHSIAEMQTKIIEIIEDEQV